MLRQGQEGTGVFRQQIAEGCAQGTPRHPQQHPLGQEQLGHLAPARPLRHEHGNGPALFLHQARQAGHQIKKGHGDDQSHH